jgi:hypothetical protein
MLSARQGNLPRRGGRWGGQQRPLECWEYAVATTANLLLVCKGKESSLVLRCLVTNSSRRRLAQFFAPCGPRG